MMVLGKHHVFIFLIYFEKLKNILKHGRQYIFEWINEEMHGLTNKFKVFITHWNNL